MTRQLYSFNSRSRVRLQFRFSRLGILTRLRLLFFLRHVFLTQYYQTQFETAIFSILSTQPILRTAVSNFSLRSTRKFELTFTRTTRSLSMAVSNITSQFPAFVLIKWRMPSNSSAGSLGAGGTRNTTSSLAFTNSSKLCT